MKAALLNNWLDLEMTDIPKPVPNDHQALIKIKLAGVCGSDIVVYRGKHLTATAPVVLGHEILGTIETLPEGYEGKFSVGQRVLMNPIIECGKCSACRRGIPWVCENLKLLGIHENGGYEEYCVVDVDKLVAVRDETPDDVAILCEPFAVGAHVMVNSKLQPGDKVFIMGGATVGLYIALFAKEAGCERVIISEINEKRRQFVESMGIETINPAETDAIEYMKEVTGGSGYDFVYDTSGAAICCLQMPDLTRCGGKMMTLNLSGDAYQFVIGKVSFKEITLVGNRLYSQADFEEGARFVEDNWQRLHLDRMVTDRLPLDKATEAVQMMINGTNICKIILEVS